MFSACRSVHFIACGQLGPWLSLAFWSLSWIASAAELPQIISLTSPTAEAQLVSINDATATFIDVTDQQQERPLADIVCWGHLSSPATADQALLADGSTLVGRVIRISRDELVINTDVWGDLTLPRRQVLAVVWQLPTGQLAQWRTRDQLVAVTHDEERLVLANGDELRGQLVEGADGELRFQAVAGEITLANELVAGWRSRIVAPKVSRQRHVIGLRDGTKLCASEVKLKRRLEATLMGGLSVVSLPEVRPVAERLIVYFRPANRRVRYLSDIKPLGHKQIPFLGERVQWEWLADRSVVGGPLSAGDRHYEKGIGMHSTSRLAFELDQTYEEFQAEVCLDKSAGNRGSVVFRVFTTIDGSNWKPTFESDILRGGNAPLPVRVNIQSAKGLALVVDYADRGDVLDRANWIGARLVRGLNSDAD